MPAVEHALAAVRALAALAMTQMVAVDVEGQAPALDIDLHQARPGLFTEALQRANAQGGVAQ
ncbi:hypothetical protein D3C86_2130550 [compost metagenome]